MNVAEQEDAEEDREKVSCGSANNSDEFAQDGKKGEYIVGKQDGAGGGTRQEKLTTWERGTTTQGTG